jgi:hypothetical protein
VLVEDVTFDNGGISGISTLTAATLTEGSATLTAGVLSGIGTLTTVSITDGTATLNSGALTLTTLSAAGVTLSAGALSGVGVLTAGTITDGTASLTGGAISGLTSLSAATITDGAAITLSGGVLTATLLTDATATLTSGSFTGLQTLSMSGLLDLSGASAQSITHTGGGGDLHILSTNSNTILESVTFDNGDVFGITTLTANTLTDGVASLFGGDLTGVGSLTMSGTLSVSGLFVAPPSSVAILADFDEIVVNSYHVQVTAGATRNDITLEAGTTDGQALFLSNVGAGDIVFSTTLSRIDTGVFTLAAGDSVYMVWIGTLWRPVVPLT